MLPAPLSDDDSLTKTMAFGLDNWQKKDADRQQLLSSMCECTCGISARPAFGGGGSMANPFRTAKSVTLVSFCPPCLTNC
jgi:hypothetical protein